MKRKDAGSVKKKCERGRRSKTKLRRKEKSLIDAVKFHVHSEAGITNLLLEDFCRQLAPRKCLGVFPSDDLANTATACRLLSLPSFSLIVNLSTSKRGRDGDGHFVTLLAKPKYLLYIDSFGLPLSPAISPHLFDFLRRCRRRGRAIFYNNKRIQGLLSPFCGIYALLFCTYFERKPKPTFVLRFSDSSISSLPFSLPTSAKQSVYFSRENDARCLRFLKRLLV